MTFEVVQYSGVWPRHVPLCYKQWIIAAFVVGTVPELPTEVNRGSSDGPVN